MDAQHSSTDLNKKAETELLRSVSSLKSMICGFADQIEEDRQLPDELLAALHRTSLFRMLLPQPFGGLEVTPGTFFSVIENIAIFDASTAWCLCQANGCSMAAAFLPSSVATEIWKDDNCAVLAWGPGKGQAKTVDGGFLLSGRWSFISGGRHAKWLGGFADIVDESGQLRRDGDNNPLQRTFLFPATKATRHETWNVIGLLGTGSDDFSVENILVPETHILSRDDPATRLYSEPLYMFPAISLYATGFAATALGVARGVFEAFISNVSDKVPRAQTHKLRDNNVIQADIGRCKARLAAARTFLQQEVYDIWDSVFYSRQLSVEQRMRIRLSSTYAIHEAKTVVDMLYEHAGATAIFATSPFERRFRDIHTIAQQVQGRQSHFQTVGAFLLGNEPDLRLV
ncbi:MAG: acyl-CoA dehydrogenase [Rhodospirillaceae bacterium]|nr:acyl-CoA dehydrogenase [Rhodospirillaceae bacterium]